MLLQGPLGERRCKRCTSCMVSNSRTCIVVPTVIRQRKEEEVPRVRIPTGERCTKNLEWSNDFGFPRLSVSSKEPH